MSSLPIGQNGKNKCECVCLQVHGQKSVWEDPVEWVRGSLPWPSAQQDQAKLFHLPPPSTGPGSPSQPGDDRPHKETPPSSVESDPLVRAQHNKTFKCIHLKYIIYIYIYICVVMVQNIPTRSNISGINILLGT